MGRSARQAYPAGRLLLTLPLTFDACAYHICKLKGINQAAEGIGGRGAESGEQRMREGESSLQNMLKFIQLFSCLLAKILIYKLA